MGHNASSAQRFGVLLAVVAATICVMVVALSVTTATSDTQHRTTVEGLSNNPHDSDGHALNRLQASHDELQARHDALDTQLNGSGVPLGSAQGGLRGSAQELDGVAQTTQVSRATTGDNQANVASKSTSVTVPMATATMATPITESSPPR